MPSAPHEAALNRQLTHATKLISDGRYHEALPRCELILEAHPHHVDALNNTAVAYSKLGHAETAVAYFERALTSDPSHENSFFNLVSLQLKRGDPMRAALTFHAHHRQIPESSQKKKLARQLWPPSLPNGLLHDDGTLNPAPIRQMHASWGDNERSPTLPFLYKALENAAQTSTGILACGGGFTALLLAHLAARQGLDVWILEHHPTWYAYLCALLERQGLEDAAHVYHAPLFEYSAFVGYDVPASVPDAFGLVVGERLAAPGSGEPYGLAPILYNRLEASCIVLLDDVAPAADAEVLERWSDEGNFVVEITREDDAAFATLSRSEAPPSAPPSPSARRRARPPHADELLERLRRDPDDEKLFYRLINLCLDAGRDEQAADLFETFEANVRESLSKQALRRTLFDRTIDLNADRPGPICIGGCGSSGTNLLRRILDTHSQIACGKEMSVFDRPRIYRLSLDELRNAYLSGALSALDQGMTVVLTGEGTKTYCGLEPGNHGDYYHTPVEVLALFDRADSVPDFLDKYFLSFAQKRGKHIWAEKTPNNIFCAGDFLETYPEGRFIQMIRDGRDVCLSLVRRRNYNLAEATMRWTMSIEAGLRVADHERVYTLRYEDLVLEPEATLERLFAWLRLPYEASVLRFNNRRKEKNAHGYAESSIHTQSAYRWKQLWSQMTPVSRRRLDLSLAQHLRAVGYAPAPVEETAADVARETEARSALLPAQNGQP